MTYPRVNTKGGTDGPNLIHDSRIQAAGWLELSYNRYLTSPEISDSLKSFFRPEIGAVQLTENII